MTVIDTDYLVVGAGAAGLAFTDDLVAHSDADVVMVDRRHQPGGHWNQAYPFVRLHLPSALYGVSSLALGHDRIDDVGPNAGFYERATGAEVSAYFHDVMETKLLPTGQVRFFAEHEHVGGDGRGEHRLVSRLTGEETTVKVRRKQVDARYLEAPVPANHRPSFEVDDGARLVTPSQLVSLDQPASGYTVIGAGKTAMDVCSWLLDLGVPADAIRWVRPRDAWLLDRVWSQPLDQVVSVMDALSLQLEAAAQAQAIPELFGLLEASGQLWRLDPEVEPTMYRCAILSQAEMASLGSITDVVRLGKVRRVGADELVLEEGSVPTEGGHVHVDCSAAGIGRPPSRPIFEPGRVTLQQVRTCQPTFNAALLGFLEASRGDDDAEANRFAPPNPYPLWATDWIPGLYRQQRANAEWDSDREVRRWVEGTRLNAARGIRAHIDEPRAQEAFGRLVTNLEPAMANLERWTGELAAQAA